MDNGGNGDGTGMGDAARVVAGWDIPLVAHRTEALRHAIQVAIEMGFDRPEDLANIALPTVVLTMGKMEVALHDANVRIDNLERALIALRDSFAPDS